MIGRNMDWNRMSPDEQQDVEQAVEIAQQAPNRGLSPTDYALWLAIAAFLTRRIKDGYGYEPRKPGASLGDVTDHGYLVRTVRSSRGQQPGTLCAVQVYLLDQGEHPPQFFEAKLHLVVRSTWFGHTAGPKSKSRTATVVPFVHERTQLEAAFREGLATTLRSVSYANEVLGIHTARPKPRKRPKAPRAWTEMDQLRSLAESVQAHLRTLALQGPEVLGTLQADVLELGYQGTLPGTTAELGGWTARAQHLLDRANDHVKLVEAQRLAAEAAARTNEQLRAEEAGQQEAQRKQEQLAREDERRRLMSIALRFLHQDVGTSSTPVAQRPPELAALWEAIPGREVEGNTTTAHLERLQTALVAAQEAWNQFLWAELLGKYGPSAKPRRTKKKDE